MKEIYEVPSYDRCCRGLGFGNVGDGGFGSEIESPAGLGSCGRITGGCESGGVGMSEFFISIFRQLDQIVVAIGIVKKGNLSLALCHGLVRGLCNHPDGVNQTGNVKKQSE